MATEIGSHFAGIVALARVKLTQVEVNEDIPHRHGPDKTTVELTESWTAEQFLSELESLTANMGHSEEEQ